MVSDSPEESKPNGNNDDDGAGNGASTAGRRVVGNQINIQLTYPKLLIAVILLLGGAWKIYREVSEAAVKTATEIATKTSPEAAKAAAESTARDVSEKIAQEVAKTTADNSARAYENQQQEDLLNEARASAQGIQGLAADMKNLIDDTKRLDTRVIKASSRESDHAKLEQTFGTPAVCFLTRVTVAGTEGEGCWLDKSETKWTLKVTRYGNGYMYCEATCIGQGPVGP